MMREKQVHHVPVVRERELLGIVSDRDVLLGGRRDEDRPPTNVQELRVEQETLVEGIMRRNVHVLDLHATMADAARVMVTNKVGSAPVVHEGRLAGIITETDLLRAFVQACH